MKNSGKNIYNPDTYLPPLSPHKKRKHSTIVESKSKSVVFEDPINLETNKTIVTNLSYEDLVLRSPRRYDFPEDDKEKVTNPKISDSSPSKSILKKKIKTSQIKIDEDTLALQDALKKNIYRRIHNGFLTIFKKIIEISDGKEHAKKLISIFFSMMADHYYAQIFSTKKSHSVAFFKVPSYSAAKSAIIIDLYRGALQIYNQPSVKSQYEKALIDLKKIEKTRKSYRHSPWKKDYLKMRTKALIKAILDDYVDTIIGLYQGSYMDQITKEFSELIEYLYTKIEKRNILKHECDKITILSELCNLQYDLLMVYPSASEDYHKLQS